MSAGSDEFIGKAGVNAFGSERQDLYISRLRSTGFDVFLSLPRDKSRPFQPFPGPAKGMRGCVAPNAGLSKPLPLMGKGLFSYRKGRPIGQPFQKLLLDHRVPTAAENIRTAFGDRGQTPSLRKSPSPCLSLNRYKTRKSFWQGGPPKNGRL